MQLELKMLLFKEQSMLTIKLWKLLLKLRIKLLKLEAMLHILSLRKLLKGTLWPKILLLGLPRLSVKMWDMLLKKSNMEPKLL